MYNKELNSQEMKTEVELFLIEETEELIYDNDQLQKYNELVSSLGLVGQTKIKQKDKSPIPFMHMKLTTINMFEVLCPRKVAVENYDVTPIPVEILDLIALSRREQYFKQIEIWYDDKTPDPICVGVLGEYVPRDRNGNWFWSTKLNSLEECVEWLSQNNHPVPDSKENSGYFNVGNRYLLGKWADVKASFSELRKRARERFIAEKTATLSKEIKEKKRELDSLDETAVEKFGVE